MLSAVALTGGLVLTGCATPELSNQSVSACYRAIPVGRGALHDRHATMVGVRRLPADQISAALPPEARAELSTENDTAVCAMVFKGSFGAGQVNLAPPAEHGTYAVVVVSTKALNLLAAAVTDHAPRGFGGPTI